MIGVISAQSWLADTQKQRASDREIQNPTRRAPNTRNSSLPAAAVRSERHVHASRTSGDYAVLLFTWRRHEDGCNSSARPLDPKNAGNAIGVQQSESNEPDIAAAPHLPLLQSCYWVLPA